MRNLIVLCLLAAIGAVAFIGHANAGQNADFCRDHSNWPGCASANPAPQPKVPHAASGPRLIFSAWRDGESVTLYVSRDGRIRRIIPNY